MTPLSLERALVGLVLGRRSANTRARQSSRQAFAWSAAVLAVLLFAAAPVRAQPFSAGRAQTRLLLSQVTFRDRQQQVLLQRAEKSLQEGRTVEGLQLLQQVLAAEQDSLMWAGSPERLVSVREAALKLLNSAGPQVWRAYERVFGLEAKRLLADAQRSDDPSKFDLVARRYPATQAGYAALSWRLSWWLDHGRYGLAARCADHLLRLSVHEQRLEAATLQKAAAAYVWSGQTRKVQELLRRFGDRVVRTQGRDVSLRQWVDQLTAAPAAQQRDWLGPGGNPRRNGVFPGSPPLVRPLWSVTLDAADGPDQRVVEWTRMAWEDVAQPVAVASSPVVVNGQLVVRDFAGVRAVDVRTGRTVWRYDSPVGWSRLISQLVQTYRQGLSEFEAAFVGNSTFATLTSDGRHVYAVEFGRTELSAGARAVPVLSPIVPFALRTAPVDEQATQWVRWNRLVALPLVPADATDEKAVVRVRPVWSVGGPPDSQAPLAGHYFLTPPLAVDGLLYVLAESQRQLKLLVLRPSTGQLVWSQTVALADSEISHPSQRNRRLSSAFPSFADGLVVCPTDLGVLVAVNAVTGQLQWVYPYREPSGSLRGRLPWVVFRNQRPLLGQAGIPPLVHVHAGRVVFLPRDSQFVHCVDLQTGRELWRAPRDTGVYVGVVTDDRVVVVGDAAVWSLSLDDGQRLWSTETGMPAGRGVAVDDVYLVPLKSGQVAAVDVNTGQLRGFAIDLESVRALPWPEASGGREGTHAAGATARPGASGKAGRTLGTGTSNGAPAATPEGSPGRTSEGSPAATSGSSPATTSERAPETTPEDSRAAASGNAAATQRPTGAAEDGASVRAGAGVDSRAEPADAVVPMVGNLLVYDDVVLAVGPRHAVAFPQAEPVLRRLLARSSGRLAGDDAVVAAALWLTLGRVDRAEQLLEANRSAEPAQRRLVDQLLTELLYIKLDRGLGDPSLLLDRLGRLAVTARQKRRYLKRRIEAELSERRFSSALRFARELAALGVDGQLPERRDVRYRVQVAQWLADVTRRARDHLPPGELADQSARLLAEVDAAFRRNDVWTLKTLAAVYTDWPEADQARVRLAELLTARGRRQEAELLLLKARHSRNEQTAGAATARLVRLYDEAGFHVEAARLLQELAERFRDVPVENGSTGQTFVARFPKRSLTWLAYRRRLPLPWPVRRVVVKERVLLQPDRGLLEAFGRYRRRYRTDPRFPFHLLEYDLLTERTISVVDAQTGRLWTRKTVPSRNSYQFWSKTPVVGHLLAMGRPGGFYSFSLFDRNTSGAYWDRTLAALKHSGEVSRPGPSGPDFCIFQSAHHLVALDPATGKVLWQRSDIPANSGLFADQMAGLFGDDQVVVLFSRMDPRTGRTPYVVYRTLTGEVLRQGWLDVDSGVQRRVFGRKLFYVSNDRATRRVKIWDPLTGRVEWESSYGGRLLAGVTPDDELVLVTPHGRLLVRDVRSGRTRLELKLPSSVLGRLGFVRAFRDQQRYYINLGTVPAARPTSVRSSLFSIDEFLPTQNFRGLVWAVDAKTGRVLWQREFPQRTFLTFPDFNLPFLVARSRIREPNNRLAKQMAIEVVDAQTGETLALDEHLLFDRMVHASYDPDAGRLELHGLQSTIEILFDRQRQAPSLLEGPL